MTALEMDVDVAGNVAVEIETEMKAHQHRVGGKLGEAMEHYEAVEMMATEKYLLDELTPELRDAYEEHFFGCAECAQDVQLGAAFIDGTKAVLPEMMASASSARVNVPTRSAPERREWFAWLRPAFMAPAFACLLAVVGYQNLVLYPSLRATTNGPRILPAVVLLHDDTRSAVPVIYADLKLGTTIAIEMPAGLKYSSYKLDFYDAKGSLIWSRAAQSDGKGDDSLSFWLSSKVKQDTYKLIISGVTATGETVQVKQQMFELQPKK